MRLSAAALSLVALALAGGARAAEEYAEAEESEYAKPRSDERGGESPAENAVDPASAPDKATLAD